MDGHVKQTTACVSQPPYIHVFHLSNTPNWKTHLRLSLCSLLQHTVDLHRPTALHPLKPRPAPSQGPLRRRQLLLKHRHLLLEQGLPD